MRKIVVFCGPPLSGKSTLAALYACEAGVPVLEMDSIRLRILPESQQSKADRNISYRCMHYTTERLILCGVREVALVATYGPWEHRRDLIEMAARCGAKLYVIQCSVEAESAADRFAARPLGHAAVDLNPQRVRDLVAGYPFSDAAPTINTTDVSAAVALSVLLRHLNSGEPLQALDQWVDCAK